jgi:hypothetical protein
MTRLERHLSFEEIRSAAHDLAGERRKARKDYETHARLASEAEREYRKKLAIAFTSHRSNEKGVGESEILANADAAEQKHTRDLEQAQAKAALLRIDELERDGAFLRQLGDWSKELETVG